MFWSTRWRVLCGTQTSTLWEPPERRRGASPAYIEDARERVRSARAPQQLVRRVEGSEDRFELRVVRFDDDVGWIEAEAPTPVRLEPLWAFRTDQREHAAARGRPFELEDYARIGRNAGARHGQISPSVHNRETVEESSAYVGAGASAGQDASQAGGRLNADELGCSRTEVDREPAAACGHFEDPPSIDLELRQDSRMNGLGLADGVPELRLELIYHRPEQGSTEPLGGFFVATRGRFAFSSGDGGEVFGRQPANVIEAVALPAGRSAGSSLEVIHL